MYLHFCVKRLFFPLLCLPLVISVSLFSSLLAFLFQSLSICLSVSFSIRSFSVCLPPLTSMCFTLALFPLPCLFLFIPDFVSPSPTAFGTVPL